MSRKVTAYLGLGTNQGDRQEQLKQAINLLNNTKGIHVRQTSSIYETAPVGYLDQPPFYNMAAEIQTILPPAQLLEAFLQIEQKFHRVRKIRWGPRTMDLDLLLYEDRCIQQEDLVVPHPRMTERAFVLVPLLEIAGDIEIPGTHKTITQWMEEIPDDQKVHKLEMILI